MMLCRPATFVGIVGLLAALAGCRGKGAPAEERSRAVPPEWIGLDATLVDAGIPGLPDVSVASLVPGEPSQQDGGSALAVVPLDLPPPPPAPLAVGERHACWIRPDERVVCWGANDAGQVNGRPGPVDGPRLVRGVEHAREVRVSAGCSCARTEAGDVRCWGACEVLPEAARAPEVTSRNDVSWTGARGLPDCTLDAHGAVSCVVEARGEAVVRAPLAGVSEKVVELAAAPELTCVRLESGAVKCWTPRDLDAGHDDVHRSWHARDVPGVATAAQIMAGAYGVCARLADGKVVCALAGQPGGPAETGTNGPSGVPIVGVPVAVEDASLLVAGVAFCALRTGGGAVCWREPEPADGDGYPETIPVRIVAALAGAAALAADEIGCALGGDGRVSCWDLSGLVDQSTRMPQARPVPDLAGILQLAVRSDVACARDGAGIVRCWHAGDEQSEPVPEVADAVDLVAAAHAFCALSRGGWLRCWPPEAPVVASDLFVTQGPAGAERVEAIGTDVCVPRAEGGHACWDRYVGFARHDPVEPVQGLRGAVQTALARGISCGLVRGGDVFCWGAQLVNATQARSMARLGRSASVTTWDGHGVCVLRATGETVCADSGAEGAAERTVGGLDGRVQAIVGGSGNRGCAVLRDGTVRCWRATDGTTAPLAEPVEGVADAIDVAVGDAHACALLRSGEVSCWAESNRFGQTGQPPSDGPSPPQRVEGLADVRAVAAGGPTTCALIDDAEVRCWGTRDDPANGWLPRTIDGLLDAREEPAVAPAAEPPAAEPVCRTVVEEPVPPLKVRGEPNRRSEVVGRLANGIEVADVERQGDWLRIEGPVEGWIPAASTREACDVTPMAAPDAGAATPAP